MSTVACPGCASQLSVAPELTGHVLACPQCQTQFQVAPPTADPAQTPSAAPPAPASPTVAQPRWRGDPNVLAAGLRLSDPAPAAPAPAVPRFRPADPATAAIPLAQDGRLPELQLAEARQQAKQAAAEKPARPLTLTLILGASLSLSVCLSLIDFSPPVSDAESQREARMAIARFYRESQPPLEPYQLLLRDAQRAHSRGDHLAERARYRDVLRMLRAEHRPTSLTESRQGDHDLEAAIARVLREE